MDRLYILLISSDMILLFVASEAYILETNSLNQNVISLLQISNSFYDENVDNMAMMV